MLAWHLVAVPDSKPVEENGLDSTAYTSKLCGVIYAQPPLALGNTLNTSYQEALYAEYFSFLFLPDAE